VKKMIGLTCAMIVGCGAGCTFAFPLTEVLANLPSIIELILKFVPTAAA
jgi:hypothetical protein